MAQNDLSIERDYSKLSLSKIKNEVAKDAWVTLKKYFNKQAQGTEAKVACVVVGTLAKEMQSENNKRQLDMVEKRIKLRELPTGDNI